MDARLGPGRRVIFSSDRDGHVHGSMFEKTSIDAGAEEAPVAGLPEFANATDWSADGHWILFSHGGTHGGIWIAAGSGQPMPFRFLDTLFEERLPRFAADSKWIAYHSNESGRFEVYIRPFSGRPADASGKIQISERGGYYVSWRQDGKKLFFIGPDSRLYAASVSDLGRQGFSASPHALFEVCPGSTPTGEATQGYAYDVAPDGQKFLFVRGDEGQYH